MTQQAASEFIHDQIASGGLRLRAQEPYAELDFAHAVSPLADLEPEKRLAAGDPAEAAIVRRVGTLIRGAYHLTIALLFVAIVVGTVGDRPLVAFAIGFLGLGFCGFANYAAGRLGQSAWIPLAVASRLTIGSAFLCVTALLVAQFH